MKLRINEGKHRVDLFLVPENDNERTEAASLARRLHGTAHMIYGAYFDYMNPEVRLIIEPKPATSD